MEQVKKQRKLKKIHIDLPKIPQPIQPLHKNEKQNMDKTQINLQLSPKLKNLRKLFFQYRSNAQIVQHSPYYISNVKNRQKIVQMISTCRYDLSEQVEKEIFEKYGWKQEQCGYLNQTSQARSRCFLQKSHKKGFNITIVFESRQYPIKIESLTTKQLIAKLKCELARIMHSLKNNYKRMELCVGFETVDQNDEINYILSCSNVDLRRFQTTELKLRPVFVSTHELQTIDNNKKSFVTLQQFKFIKCLGNGGFSTVYLVKSTLNNKYYAMKLINKKFIIDSQREGIVENQRFILGELQSDLVTGLEFAFQTKNHFALVVQYCPGGQLFYQLKKVKRMTELQAKFYFLQILCGLDYIHSKNIIYRDLKPQNLLIGIDGHVKIADFGLSKPIQTKQQKSYSFCGSPEYMAPQMLVKSGHNKMLDYYCLGALLYELVVGVPPYYSMNHQQIYEGILHQEITFPDHVEMSEQLKSMLNALLQKNCKKRLGSMFGIKEILAHPWVGKVKQSFIQNKGLVPPFVPDLQQFNFDTNDIKSDLNEINKLIEQDIKCKTQFNTYFSDQFYFQRQEWTQNVKRVQKIIQQIIAKPQKMLIKTRSIPNCLNLTTNRTQNYEQKDKHSSTLRPHISLIKATNFVRNITPSNQTTRLLRKVRSSKAFNLTTLRK